MNQSTDTHDQSAYFAGSPGVECLPADAANYANSATALPRYGSAAQVFNNSEILPARELKRLRSHQELFATSLAARLSTHLRSEILLKVANLQTMTFRQLTVSWANPSHLTLAKIEPLRGVAVLEIQPVLGLAMVERLLGGSGQTHQRGLELSEIENALLEQTVQLVLDEWCGQWKSVKELKPVILGCESNGRFVQTATADTEMLVVTMEAGFAGTAGYIQIAFPFAGLEAMIQQLSQTAEPVAKPVPAPAPPAYRWNSNFDDLCVPVTAEWHGLEMTAREIVSIKIGDVIRLNPESTQQIYIRLADRPNFTGRPGTIAGQWAVELTQLISR